MENKKQSAAYKREAAKRKNKKDIDRLINLFKPIPKDVLETLFSAMKLDMSHAEFEQKLAMYAELHMEGKLTSFVRGKGNKKENLKPVLPIEVRREAKDDNR